MELSLKDFSFSYGNKTVLKNINFSVKSGEFVCLCGLNGSGKSTLLRELGKDKRVSFMEQNESCAWDTTVQNIILMGRFIKTKGHYSERDFELVEKAAQKLGIEELLERNVFSLSGGEFQKVRIARALVMENDFLVLDEPCASLDFTFEAELLTFLKNLSLENKIGVVISIHDVNAALRFADRLAFLAKAGNKTESAEETNLIYGTADEILTEENAARVFGKGVSIFEHPLFKVRQLGF